MRKLRHLVPVVVILPLLGVACVPLSARAAEVYQPPDCGINSLYILLTLQGRAVTPLAIEALLPARHPEGYSMGELQRAARGLGVTLQGEQCRFAELPRDRPFIFYTTNHRPGGGHFVTARFVGAAKSLVQVLEPPYAPEVIPAERFRLPGTPDFLVLKPLTRAEAVPAGMLAATGAMVAIGAWFLCRRRWWHGASSR